MQLYLINRNPENACYQLLLAAAEKRGLKIRMLEQERLAIELPLTKYSGLLYRVDATPPARVLESLILGAKDITSLRRDKTVPKGAGLKLIQIAQLMAAGVPCPRVFFAADTSPTTLKKVVAKLGLPLVLKSQDGGTRGKGVAIVDSFNSLQSVAEMLDMEEVNFFYQELIKETHGRSVRAIVLNDKVIASYEMRVPATLDFRSNSSGGRATRHHIQLKPAEKALAVQAVHALNLDFGGVDLLFGPNGFLVAEVNFPCNFANSQAFTGVDIAGQMLDFLLAKHAAKTARKN